MTLRLSMLLGAALIALPTATSAQQPEPEEAIEAEAETTAETADEAAVQPDAATEAAAEATAENEAPTETQAEAAAPGPVTAVTAADIRAGLTVRDTRGGLVGTIESVEADGAVVSTGTARAKLPFSSFGKNAQGLVISLTRAELEAAVAARTPS